MRNRPQVCLLKLSFKIAVLVVINTKIMKLKFSFEAAMLVMQNRDLQNNVNIESTCLLIVSADIFYMDLPQVTFFAKLNIQIESPLSISS